MLWMCLLSIVGLCAGIGVALTVRNVKKNAHDTWVKFSTAGWILIPLGLFAIVLIAPSSDGVVAATFMASVLVGLLVFALASMILGGVLGVIERRPTFLTSRLLLVDYLFLLGASILISKFLMTPLHQYDLRQDSQAMQERQMQIAVARRHIPEPFQGMTPDEMRRGQGFSPSLINQAEEVRAMSQKLFEDQRAVYGRDTARRKAVNYSMLFGWIIGSVSLAIRARRSASYSPT